MTLDILFQDEALVAIHKPSGLLVHRSHIDPHDPTNAMHLLRDQIGQWVYPIHRLDKPTSGVLLFALSSDVARLMSEQFDRGEVNKTYQAIVRGFTPKAGVIDYPLKPIANFKTDRKPDTVKSKASVTEFLQLGQVELPYSVDKYPTSRYSLLELKPKTGRKHQLRRHLKHISHPIIGDPKYGKSKHNRFFAETFGVQRLLLAATNLEFYHPLGRHLVSIENVCQKDFDSLRKLFI